MSGARCARNRMFLQNVRPEREATMKPSRYISKGIISVIAVLLVACLVWPSDLVEAMAIAALCQAYAWCYAIPAARAKRFPRPLLWLDICCSVAGLLLAVIACGLSLAALRMPTGLWTLVYWLSAAPAILLLFSSNESAANGCARQ